MKRENYLLARLAEEAGEVVVAATKAIQYGPTEVFPENRILDKEIMNLKKEKVHQYYLYSKSLGVVE